MSTLSPNLKLVTLLVNVSTVLNSVSDTTDKLQSSTPAPTPSRNPLNRSTVLVMTVYIIVCLIGLFGNCCVIYAILRYPKMRTVTNMYILNLATADVLFLIGIPLIITTMVSGQWLFGPFMCKAYYVSANVNQFVSSVFYMILSADRFVAVCLATNSLARSYRRKPVTAKLICLAIWCFSALIMIPIMKHANMVEITLSSNRTIQTCHLIWPEEEDKVRSGFWLRRGKRKRLDLATIFTLYTFVFAYGIPVLLTVIFYSLVIMKLRSTGPKEWRKIKHKGQKSLKTPIPSTIELSYTDGPDEMSSHTGVLQSLLPSIVKAQHRIGDRLSSIFVTKENLDSSNSLSPAKGNPLKSPIKRQENVSLIVSDNNTNHGDLMTGKLTIAAKQNIHNIVNISVDDYDNDYDIENNDGGDNDIKKDKFKTTKRYPSYIGENMSSEFEPNINNNTSMIQINLQTPSPPTPAKTAVKMNTVPSSKLLNACKIVKMPSKEQPLSTPSQPQPPINTTFAERKRKNIKRVTHMVLTIIAIYILCWTPYWILQLVLRARQNRNVDSPLPRPVMYLSLAIYCFAYANSCVNPILYAFLSENFRLAFQEMFKGVSVCIMPCKKALTSLKTRQYNQNNANNNTKPEGNSKNQNLYDKQSILLGSNDQSVLTTETTTINLQGKTQPSSNNNCNNKNLAKRHVLVEEPSFME